MESETQFAFYARLRSVQQLIWIRFNVDNASIHAIAVLVAMRHDKDILENVDIDINIIDFA